MLSLKTAPDPPSGSQQSPKLDATALGWPGVPRCSWTSSWKASDQRFGPDFSVDTQTKLQVSELQHPSRGTWEVGRREEKCWELREPESQKEKKKVDKLGQPTSGDPSHRLCHCSPVHITLPVFKVV